MKPFHRILFYLLLLICLYPFVGDQSMSPLVAPISTLESHLDQVNIVRVSGTRGNTIVKEYIIKEMKKYGFDLELDHFNASTPKGTIPMTNIVAKAYPSAKKKIILAAHYDSKLFEKGIFYGTVDSATSVAMLLQVASQLNLDCKSQYQLYFVFFDGEEAFVEWTESDSVYGATHLAKKWKDDMDSFEYMVLYDLIGAKDAKGGHIGRTPYSDKFVFSALAKADAHDIIGTPTYKHFDDDHRPFMRLGLKIAHVIPKQFPSVWHTVEDTIDNVNMELVEQYEKMTLKFLLSELALCK